VFVLFCDGVVLRLLILISSLVNHLGIYSF